MDIETTGGMATQDSITEVAAVVTDGKNIKDQFQSLVYTHQPVPDHITALTGITNEMLRDAPPFNDLAPALREFLSGHVFVAHNVSFDYGFLKAHFQRAGIDYKAKRLCTVRLARKVFPGLPGYSLGKLCTWFGITNHRRHRAMGDALATTQLLHKIIENDNAGIIQQMLNQRNGEFKLPPNLPRKTFNGLPAAPGVYYFHDQAGKVIYVGKAKNIRKRVSQHFTSSYRKRNLLGLEREIADITFECTGSELIALLLEAHEIKRLWPKYNRAQKYVPGSYAIVTYTDQKGYLRLGINKAARHSPALLRCNSLAEARNTLKKLLSSWSLCERLCGLSLQPGACRRYEAGFCNGACIDKEAPAIYNQRVQQAMENIRNHPENFLVIGPGRNHTERSLVMVQNGIFQGFGYIDMDCQVQSPEEVRQYLKTLPDNQEMYHIIAGYLQQKPSDQIIVF